MGWVVLALLAVSALLILWRARVVPALWPAVGAAMALGAAGYALQSHPGLPGHPVTANAEALEVPEEEVALRDAMLGRFTRDWSFLVASDGLLRGGRVESGTQVILLGLKQYPDSILLWTGLGTALTRHDGGAVSPAAKLAFRRAMQLNPLHPGPPFFAGLAYVRAGDFWTARGLWARALALTPPDISYHRDIAIRLALLDRYLAATGVRPPAR